MGPGGPGGEGARGARGLGVDRRGLAMLHFFARIPEAATSRHFAISRWLAIGKHQQNKNKAKQ